MLEVHAPSLKSREKTVLQSVNMADWDAAYRASVTFLSIENRRVSELVAGLEES